MEHAKTIFDYLSTSIYILGPLAIWFAIGLKWAIEINKAIESSKRTPDKFEPSYFWHKNKWSIIISFVLSTGLGYGVIFFYGAVQMFFAQDLPWPESPTCAILFFIGWNWKYVIQKLQKLDMSNEEALDKIGKEIVPSKYNIKED